MLGRENAGSPAGPNFIRDFNVACCRKDSSPPDIPFGLCVKFRLKLFLHLRKRFHAGCLPGLKTDDMEPDAGPHDIANLTGQVVLRLFKAWQEFPWLKSPQESACLH